MSAASMLRRWRALEAASAASAEAAEDWDCGCEEENGFEEYGAEDEGLEGDFIGDIERRGFKGDMESRGLIGDNMGRDALIGDIESRGLKGDIDRR